jgi:hypothetical protein
MVAILRQQAKEIEQLKADLKIVMDELVKETDENSFWHDKCDAQAKEIKQLKQIVEGTIKQAFYEDDYHKLKEKFDAQAKEIEDFRFVLRNLTLATSKKIGDLEAELENCICKGGHSEAYLKVKGK